LLSHYWLSFGLGHIDAKNATFVFSAGLYFVNPKKPGQQGETMPETATHLHLPRGTKVTTSRTLIWIEDPRFQGFGCSECEWKFKPSGSLAGNSLDEMKAIFERQRDKEFAIHVCDEHRKAKKTKRPKSPGYSTADRAA
jgi:hypothetical protein